MHKIMTISCSYKWCVYIVSQVFVWSALGVAVGEAKSLVRAPLEPKLVPNCRKKTNTITDAQAIFSGHIHHFQLFITYSSVMHSSCVLISDVLACT